MTNPTAAGPTLTPVWYQNLRAFIEGQFPADDIWKEIFLTQLAARMSVSPEEELAAFMIRNGFATGHGDTFADLLGELEWQVKELRASANE